MFSISMPGVRIGSFWGSARRPRTRQTERPDDRTHEADSSTDAVSRRLELVRQHGDFSLAYTSAVQPGLKHFGDERGYLAYDERLGYTFVLADPVAATHDRERLIRQFLDHHRNAAFCQISAPTAEIVQRLGFFVNEMGVESTVSLPEFDIRSQEKKWLRTAESWTRKRGYTTREEGTADFVGIEQIESVSRAWRATRVVKRKEVRFLNRPLVSSPEPLTRRFFFFDSEQRLLAFVFFDPIHADGRLVGYVACSKRRHPDAPAYAEQAILKHAIEVFQREGCREMRMGLSPLAWIEDREYRSSWLISRLFRFGFSSPRVNKRFYNMQGHAEYKRRFRGREDKVYFATRSRFNPLQFAALIKVCKIL